MQARDTGTESGRCILLTGRPGVGKTTIIKRVVESLGVENCAGFYTEEVREGGRRLGFDVVTIGGRRAVLARVGSRAPRVGRYAVDVTSFERSGVAELEDALMGDDGRIPIIDEVGKMELLSARFRDLLEGAFAPKNRRAVLGTVMAGRHPLVDSIRARRDVKVLEVTPDNREGLPAALVAWLAARSGEGRARRG